MCRSARPAPCGFHEVGDLELAFGRLTAQALSEPAGVGAGLGPGHQRIGVRIGAQLHDAVVHARVGHRILPDGWREIAFVIGHVASARPALSGWRGQVCSTNSTGPCAVEAGACGIGVEIEFDLGGCEQIFEVRAGHPRGLAVCARHGRGRGGLLMFILAFAARGCEILAAAGTKRTVNDYGKTEP